MRYLCPECDELTRLKQEEPLRDGAKVECHKCLTVHEVSLGVVTEEPGGGPDAPVKALEGKRADTQDGDGVGRMRLKNEEDTEA